MSEIDTRPPATRGRSSHRGGRGGFGRGGARGGRKPLNGTSNESVQIDDSLEDQGELGEMKKQYASELEQLKVLFPDWTDVDLIFALQESNGDLLDTVEKISEGNVSQFAEVKSAKDRARSKVKEPPAAVVAPKEHAHRGGRGRGGHESTRGARGRGSDRGRVATRGGRGGHATTNGAAKESSLSVPTTEAAAWADDTQATSTQGSWADAAQEEHKEAAESGQSAWQNVVTSEHTPATASEGMKSSLIPKGNTNRSWASMFAKPEPVPAKTAPIAQLPATDPVESSVIAPAVSRDAEPLLPPASLEDVEPPMSVSEASPIVPPTSADVSDLMITPSKVPLTEENVEHIPDDTNPPATHTAASTAGSMDPRLLTPLPNQQAPIARPPLGGYATSAHRAAGLPARSASYQRRVLEQQEAVVMPGHGAVDRAAVQFGSMGINGELGPDVDDDREEPETRHAPQHSPPSQPKTSLPPISRQAGMPQELMVPESLPTPKQAPGLPPASHLNQQQIQESAMAPTGPSEAAQVSQGYGQYNQYRQPGTQQQESGAQQQKPYDPFGHQGQYDQYGTHAQGTQQQPQQSQSIYGHSSAPSDYAAYYTSDQQRGGYSNYYGSSYGSQDARGAAGQGQQAIGMGQQRSTSGFGAAVEPAFASQVQQQVSIDGSLLELNAALENCSNDAERRYLLNEILRVVSSAKPQTTQPATEKPPGMSAGAAQGPSDWGNLKKVDDQFYEQLLTSRQPLAALSDITNRQAPARSPLQSSPKYLYPSNLIPKQTQSRYADPIGSGHNTPNPPIGGQQQQQQQQASLTAQQSQHSMQQAPTHQQQQPQQQQQQPQSGYNQFGYPYGHPNYTSPYHEAYQNQFGYAGQPGGYGGYTNKPSGGGMYGASHGYGMAQQSPYAQHSASPANASGYAQNQQQSSMRSASGMSSGFGGLEDYGRGSAQSHQQSGGFGGMGDPFGRSSSGFGTQSGYGPQSMGGQDDSLKPYSDTKGGPSPALGQPGGGRPGSAANSAAGNNASGLPPPQSHQSAFGSGYPGFASQSQYGLGGLGSQQQGQQPQQQGQTQAQQQQHQQHAQAAYGGYGAGAYGQYGSYGSRGGWGSQYGGAH